MGDHAPQRRGVTEAAGNAPVNAIEIGRKLFAGECRFVAAVAELDRLPAAWLTEVAFAGRSNVGKSSLINALTGRNTLARTSNTPGRTQQLNFFSLADRLILVDMPGYGYAEAAKTEIARWSKVIDSYLKGRATLRRALVLVDARHGFKPNDKEMMERLDKAAVAYQIVLTKTDKLKAGELAKLTQSMLLDMKKHPAAHPEIMPTSSETGSGIPELRAALAELAVETPIPPPFE
jgi:GTP-binding protein